WAKDPSPAHDAAVKEMVTLTKTAVQADPRFREDGLANPLPDEYKAPFELYAPNPAAGDWQTGDSLPKAGSNVFGDIAAGDRDLAQHALTYLDGAGVVEALPDPPASYREPDPADSVATLQKGWGAAFTENMFLAREVVAVYDQMHGGAVTEYLSRTGL